MNRDKKGRVIPYKINKDFILSRIKKNNDCWEWLGTLNKDNYAVVGFNKKQVRVTHLVWELWCEKMFSKNIVCHHCDNPKCVNPKHLFVGTIKDNNVDMFLKGRGRLIKAGEYSGSKNPRAVLDEKQVLEIRNKYCKGVTQQKLAKEYGVSQTLISKIISCKLWRNIK